MSLSGKTLSDKSRNILKYIAQGHSYEQVLDTYPNYTYLDIFRAAQEALDIIDGNKTPSTYQERVTQIRSKYPRAYEAWTEAEETELTQYHQSGMNVNKIANRLKRQKGAIQSRLKKLGLIEE